MESHYITAPFEPPLDEESPLARNGTWQGADDESMPPHNDRAHTNK